MQYLFRRIRPQPVFSGKPDTGSLHPGFDEIILPALKDLGERAAKAGRDMKTISVSVFGAKPDEATLETYAQAGITRAILRLPPEGRDAVLPLLDQWSKFVKK